MFYPPTTAKQSPCDIQEQARHSLKEKENTGLKRKENVCRQTVIIQDGITRACISRGAIKCSSKV